MKLFPDRALPGRDVSWKSFLQELKQKVASDDITNVAAALTFYAVLGLFPFILFLVSLASFIIDASLADALVEQLARVAPGDVTSILSGLIHKISGGNQAGLLTFGIVLTIWSASGAAASLIVALNTAYGVTETRPYWKRRLIAIEATLITAALAILAALIALVVPPIIEALGIPYADKLLWLRMPIAALLMMMSWNFLYWLLPDMTDKRFRLVTPGAIVGVIVWVAASWGFSAYVNNIASYDATYGALGGIIVFLFWMWISAQVVVLGAEIDAITLRLAKKP